MSHAILTGINTDTGITDKATAVQCILREAVENTGNCCSYFFFVIVHLNLWGKVNVCTIHVYNMCISRVD